MNTSEELNKITNGVAKFSRVIFLAVYQSKSLHLPSIKTSFTIIKINFSLIRPIVLFNFSKIARDR